MPNLKGINHVGVAGAGAWGTALAQSTARAGRRTTLWAREQAVVDMVNKSHVNKAFLADVSLADEIVATASLADLAACDVVLLASPAQHLRMAALGLAQHLSSRTPVLICAKGIERETGMLMTEVATEAAPGLDFGMLSGPSFAAEVARGLPVAVTLALKDGERAARLAHALSGPSLRPYVSSDVVGVAVGGAVKNVLAIACGIIEGRGLGESARAALTARGFAEMVRFGTALGARPETLSGLSGLGDLILTASSRQSRNFSLGIQLARGGHRDANAPLAEGADTADALLVRAHRQSRDADRRSGCRDLARRHRRGHCDPRPSGAAAQVRGLKGGDMAYWLMKTEAETFGWKDQVQRGKKGEPWTGVRNFQARANLKEMKKGELAFFYHTGDEKAVVGIVKVIKEHYPDPTAEGGPWVVVDVEAVEPFKRNVTLAEIKAEPKLKDMILVRYSRLSVQPVKDDEWALICKMGGMKAK